MPYSPLVPVERFSCMITGLNAPEPNRGGNMLIVDSQVHTWAPSTPARPYEMFGEPQRPVPFTNDDLLKEMDQAGVDRAALGPPGGKGGGRNDLALAAARAHPDRFAVMVRIPLDTLATSPGALAGWR